MRECDEKYYKLCAEFPKLAGTLTMLVEGWAVVSKTLTNQSELSARGSLKSKRSLLSLYFSTVPCPTALTWLALNDGLENELVNMCMLHVLTLLHAEAMPING